MFLLWFAFFFYLDEALKKIREQEEMMKEMEEKHRTEAEDLDFKYKNEEVLTLRLLSLNPN